jgi:hypothetical protein
MMTREVVAVVAGRWRNFILAIRDHSLAASATIGVMCATALIAAYAAYASGHRDFLVWPSVLPPLVLVVSVTRAWMRGKAAPWPRWLITVTAVAPAVGASEVFTIHDHVTSLLLTGLILVRTLLPGTLTAVWRVLSHIPRVGVVLKSRLPRPTLYVVTLGLFGAWELFVLWRELADPVTAVFVSVTAAALVLAAYRRHTLWSDPVDFLARSTLSHVPAWTCALVMAMAVLNRLELGPVGGLRFFVAFGPAVFLGIALVDLASRNLQRSPVDALHERHADRVDSIQSKVEHYVDVRGLSSRLVASIERSDAGVFGHGQPYSHQLRG